MINRAVNRFIVFLGPARARMLFFLFTGTGLLSLMLNAAGRDNPQVNLIQSLLLAAFIVGAAIIIGGKLPPDDRARWTAILLPALGAIVIGLVFLPHLMPLLFGGALGWIVAGMFIFRSRVPMEYQKAIRHLRKNEYAEAIKVMDELIKQDADTPNHYRFRAELLRLSGKLDRARRDYQHMTEIAPDSAEAYNGLSEVHLQMGNHDAALAAAAKASELLPNDWVALYNLGMIEDRVGRSNDVVTHLTRALELKVPDARHRLLIHLYLARAYVRLGDMANAQKQFDALKRHGTGLEEWQKILESDQAATLKLVIGADVDTVQALVRKEITLESLGSPELTAKVSKPSS